MNDTAPPPKKRTWLWVVFGIFLVLFVMAVAGITFAVAFFRQSMTVSAMDEDGAAAEFESVRARFPGQPLIRMVDGRPEYVAERATQSAPVATPLKTMHLMAWDDDEEQLVRFSIPFWLLRLKSGPIQLSAYSQGWNDRGVSFKIEDLERAGPGIVLDFTERDGRVLVWAE
jgi:hypothetical protein